MASASTSSATSAVTPLGPPELHPSPKVPPRSPPECSPPFYTHVPPCQNDREGLVNIYHRQILPVNQRCVWYTTKTRVSFSSLIPLKATPMANRGYVPFPLAQKPRGVWLSPGPGSRGWAMGPGSRDRSIWMIIMLFGPDLTRTAWLWPARRSVWYRGYEMRDSHMRHLPGSVNVRFSKRLCLSVCPFLYWHLPYWCAECGFLVVQAGCVTLEWEYGNV